MSVKISELPILDSLADNDIVAGVDVSGNVTSKIEMATLKNYIDTNTQYTAGTNIDITNNVVSAPNVYNKTETDGLIDDLETNINEQLEEKDEQIEELQSEVDSLSTIFNAFPTESGEGESLTLDDTAEVKFKKFDLKGNTSQTTYSGYNLCKFSSFQNSIVTVNNDGTIRINGTSVGFSINYNSITLESGTAYSCIYQLVSGSVNAPNGLGIMSAFGTSGYWPGSDVKETVTPSSNLTRQGMWVAEGAVFTNAVFKVLIYKGSDIKTWEPYVGSTPTNITSSPNPSYPQPVNVVSGDNTINVVGKNLWTISKTQIGSNWHNTYVEDGETISVTATGTYAYRSYYIEDLIVGQQYTVSFDGIKDTNATYGKVTMGIGTGTSDEYGYRNMTTTKANYYITFTATSNVMHITIYPVLGSYSSGGTITISNIQLEKGSSASTYKPYQGNTYNIDLPVENLFNITLLSQEANYNTYNSSTGLWNTNSNVGYCRSILYDAIGSESARDITKLIKLKANTNYTLTFYDFVNNSTGSTRPIEIGLFNSSNTFISRMTMENKTTFTTPNQECYLDIRRSSNGGYFTFSNIQLEEGTKSNSFTPYGTTPIELCKIGNYQDYFGKSDGRNLFDSGITPENYYYDNNGEKVYQSGVEFINQEINNINYTSITISFLSSTGGALVRVCEYNLSGAFITRTLVNTNNQVVNLNNATTKIILSVNSDSNSYFTYLMINEGSTALPYEPYGVGKWYLHKEMKRIVLDGAEEWDLQSINGYGIANFQLPVADYIGGGDNLGALCDRFTKQTSFISQTQTEGFFLNVAKSLFIRINSTTANTKDIFKTWLSTNNTILYYALATPANTEITYQPLIDQLNLLEKAMSKDGQTNISQVSNDKPFILDVTAIKSLQNILDRIELLES